MPEEVVALIPVSQDEVEAGYSWICAGILVAKTQITQLSPEDRERVKRYTAALNALKVKLEAHSLLGQVERQQPDGGSSWAPTGNR
jgi:hypothetical protein